MRKIGPFQVTWGVPRKRGASRAEFISPMISDCKNLIHP